MTLRSLTVTGVFSQLSSKHPSSRSYKLFHKEQWGMGGAMLGLANMEPVVECVQCNNKLALKTKQSGGWMVSCQGEWVHRSVFTLDHIILINYL